MSTSTKLLKPSGIFGLTNLSEVNSIKGNTQSCTGLNLLREKGFWLS